MNDQHRDEVHGVLALRWYGWGSPVGLGLFALLIAASIVVVRLAFR